jgi:hypothetical protein
MKRECSYRNCNIDITEMRKDAKFCCVNCRKMEQTYKKRRVKFIEKYKQNELLKVESYKSLLKIIKEEYKN